MPTLPNLPNLPLINSNDDRHLYGLPGAEQLYFTLEDVWHKQIDGRYETQPEGGWEIEEFTVRPAISHLPTPESLIEILLENYVSDETDEGCYEDWSDCSSAEEAAVFLDAWAARVQYRMADKLVATHRITLEEGSDTLYLDGLRWYCGFDRQRSADS